MKLKGILALVCAAALTVACSNTRNETARTDGDSAVGTSGTADRVESGDRDFVLDLTEVGTAEVQLGKLASERASNAAVKQFGQTMVKDHTAANDQLKQIATTHNVPAGDAALSDDHSQLLSKLSQLKGAEFDREYVKAMVDGHGKVVDRLQTRVDERNRVATTLGREPKDVNVKAEPSNNALEASLNQWAADALPVVKNHLEQAKTLDEMLKRGRNNTASNR